MTVVSAPTSVFEVKIAADYGQFYIFCSAVVDFEDEEEDPFLDALDDAVIFARFAGCASGLVDVRTPTQRNDAIPMRIEVWPTEPLADVDDWLDQIDVDLDVPDGHLVFLASGFGEEIVIDVPEGMYRARLSGAGYGDRGEEGPGAERYRLQLWARAEDTDPDLRKSWPQWTRS